MHDDLIVSYRVDLTKKIIELYTYNEKQQTEKQLKFYEVLTHSFGNILEYNQILNIDILEIQNFIADNQEQIQRLQKYNWPIDYQNIQELKKFLTNNNYKYFKIISSYGMCGWILAKEFKIN